MFCWGKYISICIYTYVVLYGFWVFGVEFLRFLG